MATVPGACRWLSHVAKNTEGPTSNSIHESQWEESNMPMVTSICLSPSSCSPTTPLICTQAPATVLGSLRSWVQTPLANPLFARSCIRSCISWHKVGVLTSRARTLQLLPAGRRSAMVWQLSKISMIAVKRRRLVLQLAVALHCYTLLHAVQSQLPSNALLLSQEGHIAKPSLYLLQ